MGQLGDGAKGPSSPKIGSGGSRATLNEVISPVQTKPTKLLTVAPRIVSDMLPDESVAVTSTSRV